MELEQALMRRLARLARLDPTAACDAATESELGRILNYMGQLEPWAAGIAQPEAAAGALRPDETAPSLDRAEVLQGAGWSDGETFWVPKAVE